MKSRMLRKFMHAEDGDREEMSLQITSMADIFTIILIFLLKSFATGITTITPSQGMVLPQVTKATQAQMKEAIKIEILKDTILLDTKPILKVDNFVIDPEQLSEFPLALVNPVSRTIIDSLVKERYRTTDQYSTTHLTVLAHQDAPYKTIRTVINSVASAGYGDVQLVVVGGSD